MIKIEKIHVDGWEAAIRGMRNPYDSWSKSDTNFDVMLFSNYREYPGAASPEIGEKDLKLMKDLVRRGDCHSKFARMIIVTMDVTAPLYWWKQASTYKVATVENSCSTMHRIMAKPFEPSDFSYDKNGYLSETMPYVIQKLNDLRYQYMLLESNKDTKEERKKIWEAVIQLCPEAYLQKRTWQMDYQTLRNIWTWRRMHPLDEWHEFCEMIESLPYAKELITIKQETEKDG